MVELPRNIANNARKYGLPLPASRATQPTKAPISVPMILQKLASNVPPLLKYRK